eukprot:scaffold34230_cov72-Phaeocystis_antarctica.AAC.1
MATPTPGPGQTPLYALTLTLTLTLTLAGHARDARRPALRQARGLPVLRAAAQGGRRVRGHHARGGAPHMAHMQTPRPCPCRALCRAMCRAPCRAPCRAYAVHAQCACACACVCRACMQCSTLGGSAGVLRPRVRPASSRVSHSPLPRYTPLPRYHAPSSLGPGARAQDHEAAAQGEERHAADAQAGAPPDHRQGARAGRGAALQPDPAAAHVADARGSGAAPARQGHRPHPVQARRPGAALRAQDPRGHRAAAHRRGLLRARRGARDHLEPRQGRRPRDDDRDDAAGHRQRGRVRAQHDGARLRRGRLGAGRAGAAALPQGGVPVEEVVAGAAHGHQDRAADRHPARLLGAAPPALARRDHRERPAGRAAEGAHDHGALDRGARRGGHAVRHRGLRLGAQAAVEGHPAAPRQGPRGLPQGHRLHHPAHGRRVRQLLHARGDDRAAARVRLSGRGDEEDRAQGGQAVRRHRGRAAAVRARRDPARVLPQLLGAPHGARPAQLQAARRDDRGARQEGGQRRDHHARRGGPQGRERALPQDGHGDDREDRLVALGGRHRHAARGAARRRHPLRLPGADLRGHRRDAQRLRHDRQRARRAHQALPAADLRHDQVAAQQQERQGAPAGGRPHLAHRRRDAHVQRGAAHGPPRRGALRVPRRGVPRGARLDPRRAQGHRQRHRHAQDDAAHQGPAAAPHAHPQEPARGRAGELHRPRRPHRRPRRRVRVRARVDAHLLRAARHAQGAQEGHPARHRQHLRLHRQGHRAAGRARDAAQQPQGAGAAEPRLHDRRHRHRRRDVRALHGAARPHERVPHPRAQRAERRAQVALLPLRVHRRDGQGLHLRRRAHPRGRAHGPRPRPPADGVHDRHAHGARRHRAGQRGRHAAPHEPHLAQPLRDEPARDQRRHGRHRGHALLPRPHQGPAVHAAGPLPPGAQGARRLLEGLQQPLHWLAGRPRARLPAHRRRRAQPVPADAPRALPMRRARIRGYGAADLFLAETDANVKRADMSAHL